MPLSRNNHYIPQMYLSRWENEGRIYVYQLLVSHENVPVWNRQSVKNTASLPNLYLSVFKDEESDHLEHVFDVDFESPAKKALDKICKEEKMTSKDWWLISDYVVAQFVRTPSFYLWVKEWGKDNIPKQLDELGQTLSELKKVPSTTHESNEEASLLPIGVRFADEKPDENHTGVEISVVSGKGLWLFAITHTLKKHSVLRQFFSELKWSVITAPEGEYWPSCDNPVVICDADIDKGIISRASGPLGIAGKTKAILFPVSPKKLLLAMSIRKYPWRILADKKMSFMIRKAIINNALMFVYSNQEDEGIMTVRPRVVNESEYKRVKNDFENWFSNYKEIEGPLLKR